MYTDGLIERRGEPLTAGIDRLCAVLEDAPESAHAIVDHLSRGLVDADSNDDDVAILVVRVS
jgi:serine phosphatase RsbU (regulator of sigma subunit)